MIALNIEKPNSCLSCPCLWTLGNIPDEKTGNTYAIRFCAAAHKEICVYKEIEDFPLPDSFYRFPVPEWCPWIEIEK